MASTDSISFFGDVLFGDGNPEEYGYCDGAPAYLGDKRVAETVPGDFAGHECHVIVAPVGCSVLFEQSYLDTKGVLRREVAEDDDEVDVLMVDDICIMNILHCCEGERVSLFIKVIDE